MAAVAEEEVLSEAAEAELAVAEADLVVVEEVAEVLEALEAHLEVEADPIVHLGLSLFQPDLFMVQDPVEAVITVLVEAAVVVVDLGVVHY